MNNEYNNFEPYPPQEPPKEEKKETNEYRYIPYQAPQETKQESKATYDYSYIPYTDAPKAPKEKKQPKYVTMRAMAGIVAACMVLCTVLGVGGGVLTYRLLDQNSPQQPQSSSQQAGSSSQDIASEPTLDPTKDFLQTATDDEQRLTVSGVAKLVSSSIVEIRTEQVSYSSFYVQQFVTEGAGSGIIVSENGYVATNNHVIKDATKVTVRTTDGTEYEAKLVATDSETDVALIKIEASGLNAVTFADSSTLEVGDTAIAIGNPLGELGGTVTNGIISATDREINLEGEDRTLLQTNAAINPGNSGGGLFNDQGHLIGMVVAKSAGSNIEGLGFAIPSNEVRQVLDELLNYGYVRGRVEAGISMIDIQDVQTAMMYRVSRAGVYILEIKEGSAAAAAGLSAGDCILSIDGLAIKTTSDAQSVIGGHEVGDTVTFTVLRGDRQIDIPVTLAEAVPQAAPQE